MRRAGFPQKRKTVKLGTLFLVQNPKFYHFPLLRAPMRASHIPPCSRVWSRRGRRSCDAGCCWPQHLCLRLLLSLPDRPLEPAAKVLQQGQCQMWPGGGCWDGPGQESFIYVFLSVFFGMPLKIHFSLSSICFSSL